MSETENLLSQAEQILAESSKPTTDLLTQIGSFSTAESAEDYAIDPSQIKITPTQRSLAALMVRGFSLSAACRQLHINYAAAHRWKSSDWFEPVCELERTKWLQDQGIDKKQEAFAPLIAPALEALRGAMSSEDDKIRLAACQLVFEQFFDSKRPVGRPKKEHAEEVEMPDLADMRVLAEARITAMSAGIRDQNGHVNVVANG